MRKVVWVRGLTTACSGRRCAPPLMLSVRPALEVAMPRVFVCLFVLPAFVGCASSTTPSPDLSKSANYDARIMLARIGGDRPIVLASPRVQLQEGRSSEISIENNASRYSFTALVRDQGGLTLLSVEALVTESGTAPKSLKLQVPVGQDDAVKTDDIQLTVQFSRTGGA